MDLYQPLYEFFPEIRNYSMSSGFLCQFILGHWRIDYPKQLSDPPSFFWMFPLLLKELIIISYYVYFPRRPSYGVYISQLIRFARVCSHVDDFNTCNKCLTAKLLKQGFRYHKLRKAFSKFYRRHNELITKFNVGLKSLLQQGLSEPEFYGDLVYKLKKIRGMTDFSSQFRKVIMRYKRIGYNLNVMRQSACLAINPIMVDSFAALFNCTPVDRASDSMMAPT